MSRFSKSEAEARGWAFVHEQEESEDVTSITQGERRTVEGYARAEKTYNGLMINEVAPTMGLLLERIASREAHWESVEEANAQSADFETPDVLGPDGEVVRTVILPGGEQISENDLAIARQSDVIVGKDGEQRVYGGIDDVSEAQEAILARKAEIEIARTELPQDYKTKQVSVEAPALDNPGGHGGGLVVIRKGEDLDKAAERKALEAADAESDRVRGFGAEGEHEGDADAGAQGPLGAPAPEDHPELAGVDGGIAQRGDLESEQADQGATFEAVESTDDEVEVQEGPGAAEVRSDAAEEAAKGEDSPDSPEGSQAVREAQAEAEQEAADRAAGDGEPAAEDSEEELRAQESDERSFSEKTAKNDIQATEAARELAFGKIKLENVKGSGEGGRIVKSDVEAALEARKSK